ncbi:hypothetical protein MEO41_29085, partial [Dolichospermum sp. ST_sed4]|nr:hypothetical protein [Dolichospermum sp. ST_sed4]
YGANARFGARPYGLGSGGDLIVNAKEVNLTNGGVLESSTDGLGDAGNIYLTTNKLLIQDDRDNPIFQTGITSSSHADIRYIIKSKVSNF